MNFLLIWLFISAVCTGLVLLGIRFAPSWDDEPLDINSASLRQNDSRSRQEDSVASGSEGSSSDISTVMRTDFQVKSPPGPKLANYAIVRSEEPLS